MICEIVWSRYNTNFCYLATRQSFYPPVNYLPSMAGVDSAISFIAICAKTTPRLSAVTDNNDLINQILTVFLHWEFLWFLVACYATLHPALSVRRSVGPSVRRSVRPSVRRSVRGSRVSRKPQIQVNSSKFNKIQQNSRLFATVGRVTALFFL